jgi:hypothetical protein
LDRPPPLAGAAASAIASPERPPAPVVEPIERPTSGEAASGDRARPFGAPAARPWLLVLAPMLLFVAARYGFVGTDPDYWWHVKTGQYIAETGALPRVDIFSYTMAGQPWVTHEWLTQLLLYLVQQRFGYVGNVVLFGLIGMLTALAVYATCRHRGLGEPGAAVLMVGALVMGMGSANVRPQAMTALLLALCVLLLTRYKQGQPRALWALPPLLALWVNLHGGYIIGLVLLGLTVFGEAAARLLGRPAASLRPLLVVTALSAVATLLSPHALDALYYPFTYAGTQNGSMRFIAEWQSPNFHQPHFILLGTSLLLAMLLGLGQRPLGPTEVFWAVGLTIMALQSVRHIPLYAIVIIPLLAARLQAEVSGLRRPLTEWRRPALLAVTWPLVGLSILQMIPSAGDVEKMQFGREPIGASYPVGAVEYLRAHDPPGNLFNTYHWGGYLIYQLHPERPVFIDGRADVYGDRFFERYMQVTRLQPGWRQVLDEHDVGLMLVEKESPIAVVLGDDPAWQEIYAGEVERLFARRGP